jgi:CheY-like chemotaxis protein
MNNHIVYFEDDIQSARLVRMILTANGYEVTVANSTADGLRLIEIHQPVLILMDIELPDMDGTDATTYLKNSDYKHIPVIALTALAMHGDRERILAAGCDGYLTKPFNVLDLLDIVRKYAPQPADL